MKHQVDEKIDSPPDEESYPDAASSKHNGMSSYNSTVRVMNKYFPNKDPIHS